MMKVETGKVYKIFGNKQMLVVKVDRTNIHTVWPNGMIPASQFGTYLFVGMLVFGVYEYLTDDWRKS